MTNPYRDNIENRVRRNEESISECGNHIEEVRTDLEKEIKSLREQLKGAKIAPSLWGSVRSAFYNLTHWSGWGEFDGIVVLGIVGLTCTLIFGAPSCFASMGDSPEEIRAHEETRQARFREHQEACQGMGMQFIEWSNGSSRLTCGNEHQVVNIDVNDNEVTTHPIDQAGANND